MSTGIDATQLSSLALLDIAKIPKEGPKAIPLVLDFTASDSYLLDYGNQQRLNKITMVQTVFIDASLSDVPVSVSVQGLNQVITAKGRTQGYYPVCCPNPLKLVFTCITGPAGVIIILLNYPVSPCQWDTQ